MRTLERTVLENVVQMHKETGGSTTDLATGWEPERPKRYVVADSGSSECFDVLTSDVLADYIARHPILTSSKCKRVLGTWRSDSGCCWVETCYPYIHRDLALHAARNAKQTHIFDLKNRALLRVDA